MSTIFLIRHGQASFGAADYDALSPLGFEQARVLGETFAARLDRDRPLGIYAGDMRRHRETAAACLAALPHASAPAIHPGFNEYDHEQVIDCFEPRYRDRAVMQAELRAAADPRRAFQQMFEAAIARWTGGEFDADYRESWSAFRARCAAALQHVAEATPRDGVALVFTSGGTITALCQSIMDLTTPAAFRLNWTLANAGVTKLLSGAGPLRLSTLNEHGHFEGARAALLTYR
jgi:broad specificity phosphatase PhoE